MRKNILMMSQKERQRHHRLKMVLDGGNTLKDPSKLIAVMELDTVAQMEPPSEVIKLLPRNGQAREEFFVRPEVNQRILKLPHHDHAVGHPARQWITPLLIKIPF